MLRFLDCLCWQLLDWLDFVEVPLEVSSRLTASVIVLQSVSVLDVVTSLYIVIVHLHRCIIAASFFSYVAPRLFALWCPSTHSAKVESTTYNRYEHSTEQSWCCASAVSSRSISKDDATNPGMYKWVGKSRIAFSYRLVLLDVLLLSSTHTSQNTSGPATCEYLTISWMTEEMMEELWQKDWGKWCYRL